MFKSTNCDKNTPTEMPLALQTHEATLEWSNLGLNLFQFYHCYCFKIAVYFAIYHANSMLVALLILNLNAALASASQSHWGKSKA